MNYPDSWIQFLERLEIVASGILKYQINIGNTDFEDGNFLLSIEKSRNGIFLMSSSGNIVEIKNN